METLTIINGCRNHNQKFQKILYDKYRAFALKTVFRYIYNYEDAIEVTNDGFVKFFLNIDKFNYSDNADIDKLFFGWLKRIMINSAIDLLRKKMMLPEIGGIPDYVWDIKDEHSSSDQSIIYKDIITAIKKLPPTYRITFNMHVIDGYTHNEIACALNIPVGTSKSNLMRARALVKKFLEPNESIKECRI